MLLISHTKEAPMNDRLTISLFELFEIFPNEESAKKYLEGKRWGDKVVCPFCGKSEKQYRVKRNGVEGYFECGECGKVYTVRTGTIFERSHVPLHKWIFAFYLVVTSRKGISSMQLSKEIGVTQKTAWFMLQRIREACSSSHDDDDNNGFLSGIVEADGVYIGGKESNKHESQKLKAGRGTVGKTAVLGMRARAGKILAKVIPDTSRDTVHQILNKYLSRDSVLVTDEHASYKESQFNHQVVNHSAKQYVDGMAHTNGIESVWAVLKRGFYGIYHSFSTKHLQRYVDEFAYRLNEGNVKIHTWVRLDALMAKAFSTRITYAELKN